MTFYTIYSSSPVVLTIKTKDVDITFYGSNKEDDQKKYIECLRILDEDPKLPLIKDKITSYFKLMYKNDDTPEIKFIKEIKEDLSDKYYDGYIIGGYIFSNEYLTKCKICNSKISYLMNEKKEARYMQCEHEHKFMNLVNLRAWVKELK